ncbi:hypothetical protein ABZI28_000463 [Flavobacterium psychrophilum]
MKTFSIKRLILMLLAIVSLASCTRTDIEAPLVYPNPYKVLEDLNTIKDYATIKVISRTTAMAVGDMGQVIKTTDQGVTWDKLDLGTTNYLNDVDFTSDQIGWIVGESSVIKKTTNQGLNWTDKKPATLPSTENVLAVKFLNENIGVCTTATGKILMTQDGGENWTIKVAKNAIGADIVTALRSIYIKDTTTFYLVGSAGIILKTTDFGTTFTVLPTAQATNSATTILYRIKSPSNKVAYTCGSGGMVLKINLENDAITSVKPPMTETMFGISFINDNVGYLVGKFGLIFKTTDAGTSWIREKSGVSSTLTDVAYWDENLGYIVGNKLILKSKKD